MSIQNQTRNCKQNSGNRRPCLSCCWGWDVSGTRFRPSFLTRLLHYITLHYRFF